MSLFGDQEPGTPRPVRKRTSRAALRRAAPTVNRAPRETGDPFAAAVAVLRTAGLLAPGEGAGHGEMERSAAALRWRERNQKTHEVRHAQTN